MRHLLEALEAPSHNRPANLRAWLAALTDTFSQVTESGDDPRVWPNVVPSRDSTTAAGHQPVPPATYVAPVPGTTRDPHPANAPIPGAGPHQTRPVHRRHPILVRAAAAAVVLLLLGATAFVWALLSGIRARPNSSGAGPSYGTAATDAGRRPGQGIPPLPPATTPPPSMSDGPPPDRDLTTSPPAPSNAPSTPPPATPLGPSDTLYAGQSRGIDQPLRSKDGRYKLVLQQDGNLVVYTADGSVGWKSGTIGRAAARLLNQQDGNIVVVDAEGHPLCAFGTSGRPDAYLVMQNDGHLVVYAPSFGAIWDSTRGGQCL